MEYKKAYFDVLAKFAEWDLVSPTDFDKLSKMNAIDFTHSNCNYSFTSGGGRNICNLIALKLKEVRK